MSAALTDLLFHAAAIGGLVSLGTLAVVLLPWRDDELAATTAAFQQGWRLLDRVLRTDEPAVGAPPGARAEAATAARSRAA